MEVKLVEGVFEENNSELADAIGERFMLVADYNVVQQTEGLGAQIGRYVKAHELTLVGKPVVTSGGEKIKVDDANVVEMVRDAILDARINANDTILVVGGGSMLDVVGYVAAQVRGGIPIVRIPTTVASMIDSSFAETAAINAHGIKDSMVVKPTIKATLVDPSFAKTILDGVWRAGFSEAARLGAAADWKLIDLLAKVANELKNRDQDAFVEVLKKCLKVRAKKSPKGLGQWAANRLEAMSGYKLPHGYAIAMGLLVDANYALKMGKIDGTDVATMRDALFNIGALDGIPHSYKLLSQIDNILLGLDAWELSHPEDGWTVLAGAGKVAQEKIIERTTMQEAVNMIK